LGQVGQVANLRQLHDQLVVHLVLSVDGTWLVAGLWVQVEVYVATDLGEDVLLDPRQLLPEQVDIVAKISDYLASLLIVDVAEVCALV